METIGNTLLHMGYILGGSILLFVLGVPLAALVSKITTGMGFDFEIGTAKDEYGN